MKKPLKITLIAISSLIGIFIILAIILSPITTSYINKNGEQLIGRKIEVEKLHVNLLNGHFYAQNLTIFEEDRQHEWITLDTIDVKAKLLRLLTHEIYLKHIDLSKLDIKIYQEGDTFNFTSFLNQFQTDTATDKNKKRKWALSFYNISLNNSQIYYSDLQRQCDWNINDINFKAPGFSIGKRASTEAGLQFELADGGTLQTQASYDETNNSFKILLKLKDISLDNIKPYLNDIATIGKTKGTLQANLIANGNISQFLETNLSGDIAINDILIKSKEKDEILKASAITTQINKINFNQKIYHLDNIHINDFESRLDIYDDGNNFTRILPSTDTTTTNQDSIMESAPTKTDIQLQIDEFNFTNGTFIYTDHTLKEIFKMPITNINITAHDLSLSNRNHAHIQASLPRDGIIEIDWFGNIHNWRDFQEITLDITNLKLKELSPYTVHYLGHPFTNGTLTLHSVNQIKEAQIKANHHLEIAKAKVGKKNNKEAQFNVPLKAAIYVLSDNHDNIILDIPVTGDLKNPEFKYTKAIWNAIGNTLLKVASEPFKWAGNAFGITNQENYIDINPTDSTFTNTQLHYLKKYANAVKKEPTLKLYFEQHVDPTAEDFILELADARNRVLYNHLVNNLKIDTSRFSIISVDNEELKKPGYLISGELIESLDE